MMRKKDAVVGAALRRAAAEGRWRGGGEETGRRSISGVHGEATRFQKLLRWETETEAAEAVVVVVERGGADWEKGKHDVDGKGRLSGFLSEKLLQPVAITPGGPTGSHTGTWVWTVAWWACQ